MVGIELLSKMWPGERSAFVLMQRIYPTCVKNVIVRDGKRKEGNLVCELGVFGSMIVSREEKCRTPLSVTI